MSLDIYFAEDISNVIEALAQANERTLRLAESYGLDLRVSRLCAIVYQGCIQDVARAFGVDLGTVLTIPIGRKGLEGERVRPPLEDYGEPG